MRSKYRSAGGVHVQAPAACLVRTNVDGAFNEAEVLAGYGVVIRDDVGEFLAAKVKKDKAPSNVVFYEANALSCSL